MKKLLFSLVFFLGSLVLGVSAGYSQQAVQRDVCYQESVRCTNYTNTSIRVFRAENGSSHSLTEDCTGNDVLVSGFCKHKVERGNTGLKLSEKTSRKASDKTWSCTYKLSGSGQDPLKVTVGANCSSCRKEKVEIPCPKK